MLGSPDSFGVADKELILRRVPTTPNHVVIDEATGSERPSSGAFKFDADGMSVYRSSLIVEPPDACAVVAGSRVDRPARCVQFSAAACRRLTLAIAADPTTEPIVGHAHALVNRPTGMGKSRAQRHLADLARFCA